MFMNALCVSSGIKRQVSMVFRSFVGDGWHGCGLKLLCSEKTIAPLGHSIFVVFLFFHCFSLTVLFLGL
jgi:hypothetical protein